MTTIEKLVKALRNLLDDMQNVDHDCDDDTCPVIEAEKVLAAYKAEQALPITEEWLREIGFIGKDSWRVASSHQNTAKIALCFSFKTFCPSSKTSCWIEGDVTRCEIENSENFQQIPIAFPATRGDVLRLIESLGI